MPVTRQTLLPALCTHARSIVKPVDGSFVVHESSLRWCERQAEFTKVTVVKLVPLHVEDALRAKAFAYEPFLAKGGGGREDLRKSHLRTVLGDLFERDAPQNIFPSIPELVTRRTATPPVRCQCTLVLNPKA